MQQNGQEGIPSKRFDVWGRLYSRFLLEPHPALGLSRAAVSTLIVPTSDADRLLRRSDVDITVTAVPSQTNVVVRTVPLGQRWTLYEINVALVDGTWTHNRMDLGDPAGDIIAVSNYTATGGSELYVLPVPVELDELWTIRVNVGSHSVAGDLQLKLLIEIEDAF